MAEKYSIGFIYHIFFIHSSIDGHLDCFTMLATVNNASKNIKVHISFFLISVFVFLSKYPGEELLNYITVVFFKFFEESPYCFP